MTVKNLHLLADDNVDLDDYQNEDAKTERRLVWWGAVTYYFTAIFIFTHFSVMGGLLF